MKSYSVVLILLTTLVTVNSDKCYGLAMEGGGTHGAYEAGALLAITELLPPAEYKYNIITGISIGALNTCFCSGFAMGDERAMAQYVNATWSNIKGASEIANVWTGGIFWSMFFRESIYNNRNELSFLKEKTLPTKRNVTVAATNLDTGNYTKFTQDIGFENLPNACFASGAWPGVFPSVNINGSWYGDGAVTSNLDPYHAVEFCRDLGYDDSDIVMDLLFDEPMGGPGNFRSRTTLNVINRIQSVYNWYAGYWYISQTFENFEDIEFRVVLVPTKPLPPFKPGMPMDFNPKDIKFEIDLGYNDTVAYMKTNKVTRKQNLMSRFNFGTVHYI